MNNWNIFFVFNLLNNDTKSEDQRIYVSYSFWSASLFKGNAKKNNEVKLTISLSFTWPLFRSFKTHDSYGKTSNNHKRIVQQILEWCWALMSGKKSYALSPHLNGNKKIINRSFFTLCCWKFQLMFIDLEGKIAFNYTKMLPTTNDFSFPKHSSSLSVMNICSIGFLIDCIIKLKIKTTCSFYFPNDEITLYFVCFAMCDKNVCLRCVRVRLVVNLELSERN